MAVENLTQQTRGLRLEQFGNKENVLKKCARTAGTSKKTKSKAKALVEEEVSNICARRTISFSRSRSSTLF